MTGAYRFKYLSNLLLASSRTAAKGRGRARRSEFVLRRFRRLVRKLIMIRMILHQLRLTSILTPYNQFELVNNGIYDLVLAGHQSDASLIFGEESFVEEIAQLRPLNHPDEKSFLLATNFIKMNTLLQLLSSGSSQSTPVAPVIETPAGRKQRERAESSARHDGSLLFAAQSVHADDRLPDQIARRRTNDSINSETIAIPSEQRPRLVQPEFVRSLPAEHRQSARLERQRRTSGGQRRRSVGRADRLDSLQSFFDSTTNLTRRGKSRPADRTDQNQRRRESACQAERREAKDVFHSNEIVSRRTDAKRAANVEGEISVGRDERLVDTIVIDFISRFSLFSSKNKKINLIVRRSFCFSN